MGHLTLISEDVINSLEHFPPDLRLVVAQYAPQPEWDEYVTGRYKETKKKDTSLLGGGKPVLAPGMRNGSTQWRVDEAETSTNAPPTAAAATKDSDEGEGEAMKGELRRDIKVARETSADFGVAPMEDDDDDFQDGPPQVMAHVSGHDC